jgi:cytidine deaminase
MASTDKFGISESMLSELITAALAAQTNAYCPYSHFPVGAAVLTADGSLFKGCNVENSSFGITICAERSAIAAAVTAGHLSIKAVAVVTSANSVARPCGACRQVISEFSSTTRPTVIISVSGKGEQVIETIDDLLPHGFTLL